MTTATDLDVDSLSARFESWAARDIVAWAIGTFGERLAVPSSMGDTVLVHLAASVDPSVEIVFLDTGFHFPETLVTLERASQRYRLNVVVQRPAADAPDVFAAGVEACCAARKVDGLERALHTKAAWMTGLRRSDSPERADTPIVALDRRGLVKICPLARWSDADVERYSAEHDVVRNPLVERGYPSIGCWPCTQPVGPGEDARSGRWKGTPKTECGLHL